ncbi:hypothetical protein OPIT5_25325 [Opitutaceae bacterium TAV5]|nr:hypothetical protein OPIT5_25325 [Opitutaceae bacterium TAV5]
MNASVFPLALAAASPVSGIVLDPLFPVPFVLLLALILGALALWTWWRTARRLARRHRAALALLRLAAIALVLVLLLQPSRIETLPAAARERVTLIAIDDSRSMRQRDAGRLARLDAARNLLADAGLLPPAAVSPDIRFFRFGDSASPLSPADIADLRPDSPDTRFHESIRHILDTLAPGEGAHALFLLTDGHDHELVNPAQTALLARNRQVPVHAVPFGSDGIVRDVSVRVVSYQPYHYIRQSVRLTASVRPLGCPYETLDVALLREGVEVERREVVVRDEAQVPVTFEFSEPEAGQFEYEIRIAPLPGEANPGNNSAVSYVNIIDKKIRVLLLEGQPYWDTTFLLRSLRRNDKLDVDSAVAYAPGRIRVNRTTEDSPRFEMPRTASDWNGYDLVILGRAVDKILSPDQIGELARCVQDLGGAVVFARADAFAGGDADRNLQPVSWGDLVRQPAPLRVGREGQNLAPFRLLADASSRAEELPDLIGGYAAGEKKSLATTLAGLDEPGAFPAMIHRRQGVGQVLAIGVDGLWRWAFNAKVESANTVFDRFWDQTVLWLMGGRDALPNSPYTFRGDTANVLLGEKIRFRVIPRDSLRPLPAVPVIIRRDGSEVARLTATPPAAASVSGAGIADIAETAGINLRLAADYVPVATGRHTAEATLPDGSTQTVRFIVFDDNLEETEVAADLAWLRRLCEGSGGRLLRPEEFAKTLAAVSAPATDADTPRTRTVTIWDRAWLAWLIAALFALEWWLRRRLGLC